MKNTYLIWKDPSCNGVNPEWINLSRDEFLVFIKLLENKNRRFIKLSSTNDDGSDGRIIIEATEAQYRDWLVEKRHAQYLRDINPGYKVNSYHADDNEDEDFCGEELMADMECEVELECFGNIYIKALRVAITKLNEEELHMITYLYLLEEKGTECGYSTLTGIPQKTVNDRKKRILKKIGENM